MAYEAEDVYEYDDPLEFEFEQLKNEAGCHTASLFLHATHNYYISH